MYRPFYNRYPAHPKGAGDRQVLFWAGGPRSCGTSLWRRRVVASWYLQGYSKRAGARSTCEAPNRRNAHNNGARGYDSCAHVGAPFKTKMSASVRFHSCLPVIQKFRMKKRAGQSLTLNYAATRLAQSEGSEANPGPARVSGTRRPRLKAQRRSAGRASRHRMPLIRRPVPTGQPRSTRRTRGQTDFGDHAPELFESWTQSNRAIKGPCLSPCL
jgi:hypothetical protein